MERAIELTAWFLTIIYILIGIFFITKAPELSALPIITAIVTCPYIRKKAKEKSQQKQKDRTFYKNKSLFSPYNDFVYIISNDTFECGIFKIGMTTKSPKERIGQINSATGVPDPFKIDMLISTPEALKLEKSLHKKFADTRVNNNREFFKLSRKDLAWIIENTNVISIDFDHLKAKHKMNFMYHKPGK
ncbi:MAG: GIY-YIG nuclease family protein [Marinobacterium sp.]|nr:GIY-YIG nuclease family protein [Marinobacterium sp.]